MVPPPTVPATNPMPITTGDTRMSVMPQVAFPAPVQIPDPLAGLNSGLDTAGKYAQLAENEQMNPLRQQLAQLNVYAQRAENEQMNPIRQQLAQLQVKENQRNLLKPILQPTTQEVVTESRPVAPVFNQEAYGTDYKTTYDTAYDEAISTGSNADVADRYAHEKATALTDRDAYYVQQPNAQDRFIKSNAINLETGAPVSTTTFNKGAEEIADAEARVKASAKNPWQNFQAVGSDGKQHAYSWNAVTGMQIDHGVAGVAQSNIERNASAVDLNASTVTLNAQRLKNLEQTYTLAAQTAQGQEIYARLGLTDKGVRQQYAAAAVKAGMALSAYVLLTKKDHASEIYGYLRAKASGVPINSILASNGLAYSPKVVQDADNLEREAAQYEQGLDAAAAAANTPAQPADAPLFQLDIPANPAVAGQPNVTVQPGINVSAPVGMAPTSGIPRGAVAKLLMHPELKADFDSMYGTGSADQILNAHP